MSKENELTPFTFESTGVTAKLRKVSPYLVFELQRSFPPPDAPMQEVSYGDGETRLEANPAHPDYLKEYQRYQLDLEGKIRRLMIKRGVVCEFDKQEVADLREFWISEYEKELPEKDDFVAYITYLAMGTQEDAEELIAAITRRSQPTEAAVQLAQGTFQR